MTDLASRTHVLYRLYDGGGVLLYVGISVSAAERWGDHRTGKGWWVDVSAIRLEHFPSRYTAERAEQAAIRNEGPRHNIRHAAVLSPVPAPRPPRVAAHDTSKAMQHLKRCTANRKAAEVEDGASRDHLRDVIGHALDAGLRQVDVVGITGYTREHVRRLAEAARKDQNRQEV